MKVCLKKYGKDSTGVIYSKETLQHAIDKLNDSALGNTLLGTVSPSIDDGNVDIRNVAFTVNNLSLDEDGLYGYINTLNTPNGTIIQNIIPISRFSVAGIGMVDTDGNVSDYTLTSAYIKR